MELNNTLRNLLAKNIVRFTFVKLDGTIRHAVGTRNLDLARAYLHAKPETRDFEIPTPTGEEKPYSYYDLEKKGWRSYKPENLKSIDGFEPIPSVRETPVERKPVSTPTPVRETPVERKPVSTPTEKGGEIPTGGKFGGGIGMGGFGGGMPMGGGIGMGGFGGGEGIPVVGTPTPVGEGVAMPVGGIPIEVFARMVAKYVAEELATRLQG